MAPTEVEPGQIIQFGRPPNRIDLLNRISGLTFEDVWPSRTEAFMRQGVEAISVHSLVSTS